MVNVSRLASVQAVRRQGALATAACALRLIAAPAKRAGNAPTTQERDTFACILQGTMLPPCASVPRQKALRFSWLDRVGHHMTSSAAGWAARRILHAVGALGGMVTTFGSSSLTWAAAQFIITQHVGNTLGERRAGGRPNVRIALHCRSTRSKMSQVRKQSTW